MALNGIENPFIPDEFPTPGNDITGLKSPIAGQPGLFEIIPGARGPVSANALAQMAGLPPPDPLSAALRGVCVVEEPAGQVFPPVNSLPFSVYQRVLVTLGPTPDSEQINSQTNVEIANRVPLALPLVDTLTNNNWTTIVNGQGEAAGLDIPPGHAAIIDTFGVTTFSDLAEFDILWSIGVGVVGLSSINANKNLLPQQRGWRYGSADHPYKLGGNRVILPTQDPLRLSAFAVHSIDPAGVPGQWKPTGHYVEVSMTGWLIPNFKQRPGSQGYKESGALF